MESNEVKTAIFTSSPKKAPGNDQLSFPIIKQAYNAIPDLINRAYKALFKFGYHPKIWRKAVGVILLKPNKKDYNVPKAYRIISLINCLGKTLEKILATRLEYLANIPGAELLEENQMGGRKQRSAIDAVLLVLDYIQKNKTGKKGKRNIATTIFLDVKGAFNYVAKNQLLAICKQLGLPITFCL